MAHILTPIIPGLSRSARRGVAAMEFAIIAPVMAIILFGAVDLGRAFIAWQQVNNAAEAIVQAAEKLSVVSTNASPPSLTAAQMQAAMSSIYAEMLGLDLGRGDGWLGPGGYSVTLSEIVFTPVCSAASNCPAQTPYTYWSSYLTEGGAKLNQPPAVQSSSLLRACGNALTPVAYFPNDSTQLTKMIQPTLDTSIVGTNPSLTLSPQLVADVSFTFYPSFYKFLTSSVTFRASATLPTPVGDTSVPVTAAGVVAGSANPVVCNVSLTN